MQRWWDLESDCSELLRDVFAHNEAVIYMISNQAYFMGLSSEKREQMVMGD
jgi:hypothetical protein